MTAIDVHAHYYPPDYVELVRSLADGDGPGGRDARQFLGNRQIASLPAFTGELEQRLNLLDRAGIDVQILSFASMNIYHETPSVRAALAATFNDGCQAANHEHQGRYCFFATVPLPHVDLAISESLRAREMSGFAGFVMPTHVEGTPIDDARFDDLYSAWNTEPTLVFLHPDGFCVPGVLVDYSMEWGVGAPFEDTVVAIRLLRSGLLDRYPNITWIVPHLGGTLPFLWHRLVWRWALDARLGRGEHRSAMAVDRIMLDTANSTAPNLALASAVLPEARLVLGTDYPFVDDDALLDSVRNIRGAGGALDIDRVLRRGIEEQLPAAVTARTGVAHAMKETL